MFSAKTISDRICGLIYIATFANIIHLNLNRPTKIAVCAPGLRDRSLFMVGGGGGGGGGTEEKCFSWQKFC